LCNSDEDRTRADALANKLLHKDNITFWKDVFKMNRTNINVLASTINGITGEDNITNLWHDHFSDLLNSNSDILYMSDVNIVTTFPKFSVSEIREAIINLKSGKSAGTDSLQSEHFKYADSRLFSILCMIFNAMFPMDTYHLS
jgi:hypothetical protein